MEKPNQGKWNARRISGTIERKAWLLYPWFFFFKIFWCGPFLKSLLNLLKHCLHFMFWFFGPKAYVILVPRESESHSVMSESLTPHGLSPWNSPGQNTGVSSLSILQGIFPTKELNTGFLHCRHILYQLRYKGSPGVLEWVAYPFSSGSSWPRNWTGVSRTSGRFFRNELSGKSHYLS